MMLLDVCSFLVSLGSLALIQTRETPLPAKAHASAWHELFDGWCIIHAHPVLRQLVFADMLGAMGGGFFTALYGIYVLRDLSMSPAIYDY